MKIIYTIISVIIILCILTCSDLSLYYAFMGLELWYEKMIPSLLPFMILSGIMIRLHLTENFVTFIYPIIKRLFHVSKNVCYAMLMGFLCGFPMGAKTVADLYGNNMITKREAEFLLAFCNNIGPVYFIGFVLPLLQKELFAPYLAGMYGIPLLYGLALRYTVFQDIRIKPTKTGKSAFSDSVHEVKIQLLNAVDESVTSSLNSILKLGGYMILFNLLNILPHIMLGQKPLIMAPLFEISGGLNLLQQRAPLYTLLLLPFGGLSCIAQTNSCISNTDLSIADYTLHKFILTVGTAVYYLLWFALFPNSFMR